MWKMAETERHAIQLSKDIDMPYIYNIATTTISSITRSPHTGESGVTMNSSGRD